MVRESRAEDEERRAHTAPNIRYENNYFNVFSLIKNYCRIVRWKIWLCQPASVSLSLSERVCVCVSVFIWGFWSHFIRNFLCEPVIQVQFRMMIMMMMTILSTCVLYSSSLSPSLLFSSLLSLYLRFGARKWSHRKANTIQNIFQKPQHRSIEWPTNINCVFVDIIIEVRLL